MFFKAIEIIIIIPSNICLNKHLDIDHKSIFRVKKFSNS